jgi:hypothetical protein
MLTAQSPRRLRARKRARCKVKVLTRLDAVMLRRIMAPPPGPRRTR